MFRSHLGVGGVPMDRMPLSSMSVAQLESRQLLVDAKLSAYERLRNSREMTVDELDLFQRCGDESIAIEREMCRAKSDVVSGQKRTFGNM